MQYRRFGRTNWNVSRIGHGLWGMSGWSGSNDDESRRALRLALDLGCNFFDSAWAYGEGKSDRLLGELIRANPKKRIYAASKVPPKNRAWPASGKLDEAFPQPYVLQTAEKVRKALGVEKIDLLQLHVWDDSWTPGLLPTVEKLRKEGLIDALGLSLNRWEPWNGIKAIRTGAVDAVQVIYNIFDQASEDELFPLCRELDVGIIARVPLDEGSLGGQMTPDTRFPKGDWRSSYFGPKNLGPTLERVEKLKRMVPNGMTLPDMAFRFIFSNADVATAIVGMRREAHVRENCATPDGRTLDAALLAELRKHRWDRKPAPWNA